MAGIPTVPGKSLLGGVAPLADDAVVAAKGLGLGGSKRGADPSDLLPDGTPKHRSNRPAGNATSAASASQTPGQMLDTALATADNIANTGGMVAGMPDFIAMAGTGLSAIGAKGVGAALHKPQAYLNQSFGDFGKKLGVNAPKALHDAPVGRTIMNASFLATPFIGIGTGLRRLFRNRSAIDEIEQDIAAERKRTGVAPSSAVDQLDLSETNKDMLGVGVNAAAGMWGLRSWKKTGDVGMAVFMVPLLAEMGLGMLFPSGGADAYNDLKSAFKSGQKATAEQYAVVIGRMSKELTVRGGEGSPFTKKVAERLAAAQVTPGALMRMMRDGEFKKNYIDPIIAEHHAKKHGAPAMPPVLQPFTQQNGNSHQQAVNAGTKFKRQAAPVQVVGDGKFTGNLAQEQRNDPLGLGALPQTR